MNAVCFSSKSDDWKTPSSLYNLFIKNGFLDLFPFKSSYDEFNNDYHYKKLFINPPYSSLRGKKFKNWLYNQIINKNEIYLLIPSRTDTELFNFLFNYSNDIYFIKGRLKFNDSHSSAPFPSALFYINLCFRSNCYFHNLSLDSLIYNLEFNFSR